jgi:hypothetical protein
MLISWGKSLDTVVIRLIVERSKVDRVIPNIVLRIIISRREYE